MEHLLVTVVQIEGMLNLETLLDRMRRLVLERHPACLLVDDEDAFLQVVEQLFLALARQLSTHKLLPNPVEAQRRVNL